MTLLGNPWLFLVRSQNGKLTQLANSWKLLSAKGLSSTNCQSAAKERNQVANRGTMAEASGVDSKLGKLRHQNFDYFLVLDFEATCEQNRPVKPQEIIEFPVLKINAKTLETDAVFHQYVLPRVHPQLTAFCTQLTGIIQDMVDGQPHLEDTLKSFDQWMADQGLLNPDVNSLFVTCGDWDLNKMLPTQCSFFNIPVPGYFKQWLNIKKAFAEVTSTYPRGMMSMLNQLNIQHQGRHHSGVDDCKNIANILRELLRRGYIGKVSGSRQ